mmetsp:Transcript_16889/g.35009  ORF Transcript_16889/g.35009 Transcript_16889/m.35009 type:complete len:116 (-) Transcript_16889:498-845(-)
MSMTLSNSLRLLRGYPSLESTMSDPPQRVRFGGLAFHQSQSSGHNAPLMRFDAGRTDDGFLPPALGEWRSQDIPVRYAARSWPREKDISMLSAFVCSVVKIMWLTDKAGGRGPEG